MYQGVVTQLSTLHPTMDCIAPSWHGSPLGFVTSANNCLWQPGHLHSQIYKAWTPTWIACCMSPSRVSM
jgi:hypothetical protein